MPTEVGPTLRLPTGCSAVELPKILLLLIKPPDKQSKYFAQRNKDHIKTGRKASTPGTETLLTIWDFVD
jgi:hypothetical protein